MHNESRMLSGTTNKAKKAASQAGQLTKKKKGKKWK